MVEEITGRLEYWIYDERNNIFWGDLYGDVHNRWRDGQDIHTSTVTTPEAPLSKEGDVIETLNSKYLLGKKMEVALKMGDEVLEVLDADLRLFM